MTRTLSLSLVALATCCGGSANEPPALNRVQDFDNQAPRSVRNQPPRGTVIHEPFTPPITAAKIRTAIDDAV